jgi:hypothetical protein
MTAAQALALYKIVARIIAAIEGTKFYQEGKEAAYAEQAEEARRRIAEADAARADVDALATDDVHDPHRRD